MLVREARAEDLPFIKLAQVRMALETEAMQLDPEVVDKGVDAAFADQSKGRYFVCEINGEPAACLLTIPEWSDWRNGYIWWIHSVFVSPDHRRKGVYRKMYEHIQDLVKIDPDLRGIRLYVDKSNKRAQETYTALGMNDDHYSLFEWLPE